MFYSSAGHQDRPDGGETMDIDPNAPALCDGCHGAGQPDADGPCTDCGGTGLVPLHQTFLYTILTTVI